MPPSQWRRGTKAAKLIRTCSAMRVFSGSTVTGPRRETAASTRSNAARTAGDARAKCRSRSPSGAQECVWLRLAKARPHRGQSHIGVTGPR